MGFNNGYDAGYDDAKAELMPKIKALEAQLASAEDADGASSNSVYAPGPSSSGSGTAPGGTVGTSGPSTGPVALRNNALNIVSVNVTLDPHGGWADRATTGANRPDPVYDANNYTWSVPDYDWSTDGYFSNDILTLQGYVYGESSWESPDTVQFIGDVSIIASRRYLVVSVTPTEDGAVVVARPDFVNSDESSYDVTFYLIFEGDSTGGQGETTVEDPEYGYGGVQCYIGDATTLKQGDALDAEFWSDNQPRILNFTPRQDQYLVPSGFKLVVPEADGNKPRRLQALLTVNGTGGVNVSGILEAPQGTTLVKDTSVTTGHVSSGSGDSTLISFVETVSGTVAVATLNAPASSIWPQGNS